MSKLVICEKPSVAKSIASALGVASRADGYYEGNGYLVSWCIGHLVGLADAAAYDEKFKKWRYDHLPILPNPFRYEVATDKAAQFHILKKLMERPDVAGLVSDKDVSDHHAIIPTSSLQALYPSLPPMAKAHSRRCNSSPQQISDLPGTPSEKADIAALPVGERNILLLVCCKLLCAAATPYVYEAVTAAFECGGHAFTAKGRRVLSEGWREIDRLFRSSLKEKNEDEESGGTLPDFNEGQTFENVPVSVTEHYTARPKPSPKIPPWRLWSALGRTKCRRMRSEKDLEPRRRGHPSSKSWCPADFWSAGARA